MEGLHENLFEPLSTASAKYSSTSGLSGGLTIRSIFVRLPIPNKPVLVTVVATGLYGPKFLLAMLPLSVAMREIEDIWRGDICVRCGDVGGVRASEEESIELHDGLMMSLVLSAQVVKKMEVVSVSSAILWEGEVALVRLEALGRFGGEGVRFSIGAEVIMRCRSCNIARMALFCRASQPSRMAVKSIGILGS